MSSLEHVLVDAGHLGVVEQEILTARRSIQVIHASVTVVPHSRRGRPRMAMGTGMGHSDTTLVRTGM